MKERALLIFGLVLSSSTKTKEAKSAFPRWDGDKLWTTMGHLYKGGMWFKKKVYISGFNANTTVDGTDWRTNENVNSWPASRTLPSASDADNYFYLPALGYYSSGWQYFVGEFAYYWSSSANPRLINSAYCLGFISSSVDVGSYHRGYGFRVGTFEYSSRLPFKAPSRPSPKGEGA